MIDDLVKRLRKVDPDAPGERTRWYRNPDGPEAAAEIERLREALEAERQRADKAENERDARHGGEKWYAKHLHIANAQLASVSRDRDELRLEIEKKRAALKQIAFGPPHEGEVKTVLNQLVEIAQNELKETSK